MFTILNRMRYLNVLTENDVHAAILLNPNLPVKERDYFKYTFESEA